MFVTRNYVKRETEKSDWNGAIGAVKLEAPDGKWMLDGKELSADSIEYLMGFALQSLQDAYAGAKSLADATAAFEKKRTAIIEGTLGQRGGGAEEEPHMRYVRQIIRKALGAKNKEAYDAIGSDEQAKRKDFLDGLFASLDDAKRATVEKEAKRLLKIDLDAKRAAKDAGGDLGL